MILGRVDTASESLFTYGSGESYSTYQNLDWTPYFTIGLLPSDASQVCGNITECNVVYFITQNQAAAAATAIAALTAQAVASTLGEYILFSFMCIKF